MVKVLTLTSVNNNHLQWPPHFQLWKKCLSFMYATSSTWTTGGTEGEEEWPCSCGQFKEVVQEQIRKRWTLNDLDESSSLVLASAVDPWFKKLKILSDSDASAVNKTLLKCIKVFDEVEGEPEPKKKQGDSIRHFAWSRGGHFMTHPQWVSWTGTLQSLHYHRRSRHWHGGRTMQVGFRVCLK